MTIENIWNFDLKRGKGHDPKDGACLMDAISWFEYGTLGDHPECSCPVIAAYCRNTNDAMTDIGRQKLKIFIPRLIGNRDPSAEKARAEYLVWQAIRVFTPFWLDKAGIHEKATELRNFAGTLAEARILLAAAYATASNAARALAATAYATAAAAYTTAANAASAANAYVNAASAASNAASASNACAAYVNAAANAADAAADAATAASGYAYPAKWEPLMMAALDGVLRIGKQAEPIEQARVVSANEAFQRAREKV